jgi:hypothetical protein
MESESENTQTQPIKRPRGRPKGSKNSPKELRHKTTRTIKTQPLKTRTKRTADQITTPLNEIEELRKEVEQLRRENEFLKNKKCIKRPLSNTPLGILHALSENIYSSEYESGLWKDSVFETLDKLKNDCSGKAGELLIEQLCKIGKIPHIYNGNTNSKDGTYDIVLNEKKVEIKTAKLGKQKSFQHESLRNSGYDYILFIDVCPDYYYVTIVPRFDLTKKSDILGKTAHLRKGTTDVFKLDFTEKNIDGLVEKGHTLKITDDTTIADVVAFMNSKVV